MENPGVSLTKLPIAMIVWYLMLLYIPLISAQSETAGTVQKTVLPSKSRDFEVMVAPLIPNKRYGPPTLVELKGGRILIAYDDWTMLGENSDFAPAYIAGRISEDGGRSWGRPFVLQENTAARGRMGPSSLFRLRNGDIGFVFGELISLADYRYYFSRSKDEAKTWSKPVLMTKGQSYYIINNHRMIQLTSGRLLAPFASIPDYRNAKDYSWEGFSYYSDDNGQTWHEGQGRVKLPKYLTGVQEPGFVELKDGRVMMIIRNEHQRVYNSISRDQGETWSEPQPIEQLLAPRSPATIMRIPTTGDLAIVWNYSPKVLRTPLAIAISRDEGKTWENIKYLETGYYSYAYVAFLFLQNTNQLVLSYWVDHTTDRPSPGIGLKVRGIDIKWLYEPE